MENFTILKLPLTLKSTTDVDKADISFGFIMKTKSLRVKKEPFEISVPMLINIGRVKRAMAPSSA
jgi:hypothetical protein